MERYTDIIPGDGPTPCSILLCGERPGKEEYYRGQPFVGKSGRELDRYLLNDVGVDRSRVYVTNLVKDFHPDNADPTPEEIKRDEPLLIEELKVVRPKFIGLVGRYAARYFLGNDLDMEWAHGLPFVSSQGRFHLMPLYHPAFGLHSPHVTHLVWSDYVAFGKLVRGEPLTLPKDEYPDVEYKLLRDSLPLFLCDMPLYVDTEGSAESPWGLSFTQEPGKGYVILAKNKPLLKRFAAVIKKLDLEVVCHPVIHDMGVLRAMGVEFDRYRCTMTKAYLNTLVPQGLKPLARRTCGVVQQDYEDVMSQANRDKAVDWLMKAWEWAQANDSSSRSRTTQGRREKSVVAR